MAALSARALPSGRRIAPSILAADYTRLGERVSEVLDAGARVIHVDVMDGHFVPPITVGPLIVDAIRDRVHDASAMVEAHLMIERPERQVADFARAGADLITVHAEATAHLHGVIEAIHEAGALAGAALNPATPPLALAEIAELVDLVLCMTVNPGWGGQSFIPASIGKLARLREMLPETTALEVDGGIDATTAGPCAEAGATRFVAGSAVFGAPDPAAAYRALVEAAGAE